MAILADLWQKLGQLTHQWVIKIFGPSQEVRSLEELNQGLEAKIICLEENLEKQAIELTQACQLILSHEIILQGIQNDYEQDSLYFMEFRRLAVNFIRAYHTSFIKRRAATSMLVQFLEESLEITNEETYQKNKKAKSLHIEDAVEQFRNFLASFQLKKLNPETSS